jgi:hypothetical protein
VSSAAGVEVSSTHGGVPTTHGGGFGPRELDAVAAARRTRQRRMAAALLALPCAAYFALELVYVTHLPLGMDELHGAGTVHKLQHAVPYVDFAPYKNVLGYYLQLPFLLLGSGGLWQQMISVKVGMAAVTALVVFACAVALSRQLRLGSVLLSTVLLCCMSTFLERSAELRVDMLTSLAGLGSLVALLSGRFVLSGALAGLSFLVSQKGIYFCAAGGVALLARALSPQRPAGAVRDGVMFGAAAAAPFALYFALFSALSSPTVVAEKSIGVASDMAKLDLYRTLHRFWWQTVNRNPLFYGLALLGIGAAFERGLRGRAADASAERDRVLWTYAGTVVVLCFGHRQPWPYFFVLLIPTLWVVIAVTLEHLPQRGLLFWALFVFAGVVAPLGRSDVVLARDNSYLRYTIELAERLLAPDERYLAGIDMVHTRSQVPGLGWLDQRKLAALRTKGPKLIEQLRAAPPKLVIWNYRVDGLPEPARRYLRSQYRQFWASVYTYAPVVAEQRFELAYGGRYVVRDAKPVVIDGKKVAGGRSIELAVGPHTIDRVGVRLQWQPASQVQKRLDPKRRREGRLFDRVYDY